MIAGNMICYLWVLPCSMNYDYNMGVEIETEDMAMDPGIDISAVSGDMGLQYRGAWRRLVALIIDFAVFFIITAIIGAILGTGNVTTFLMLAIIIMYFIGSWALWGQTLGKKIMRARIVKVNGDPIGWGTALLRFIGLFGSYLAASYSTYIHYIVSLIVFLLLFLIIATSSKKRGIHDLFAGTVVVKSR